MAARSNETRRGEGTEGSWVAGRRRRGFRGLGGTAMTVVAGCAPPAPPRARQGRRLYCEEKALLSSPGVVLVACPRGQPCE